MDRKEALELLGLGEDADEFDIERRFTVLARRKHAEGLPGENDARIVEAYNHLTGRDEPVVEVPPKLRRKLFGRSLYEWKNRWYYLKWTLLGILVASLAGGSLIYTIATHNKPDFKAAVVGTFAVLADDIYSEDFPAHAFVREHAGAANPQFEYLPLDELDNSEMELGVRMQMSIILSGANPVDLLVTNDYAFNFYSASGLFAPLEDLYEKLRATTDPEFFSQIKPLYGTVLDADGKPDGDPYLMGLDFTGTGVIEGLGLSGDRNILSIGAVGKFTDKSEALILAICEEHEALTVRGEELKQWLRDKLAALTPSTASTTTTG